MSVDRGGWKIKLGFKKEELKEKSEKQSEASAW